MLIIHLQARHPEMNAAKNPIINALVLMLPITASVPSFIILTVSSSASPKMGGITIKKENCAKDALLFPKSRPVAIVLPERERPGNTATACAKPMINASFRLIYSFWRGRA